jgi:hypothetical protein
LHENALHDMPISSGGATASGSSFGGASVSKVSIGLCSLIFRLVILTRKIMLSNFLFHLMFTHFHVAEGEVKTLGASLDVTKSL